MSCHYHQTINKLDDITDLILVQQTSLLYQFCWSIFSQKCSKYVSFQSLDMAHTFLFIAHPNF